MILGVTCTSPKPIRQFPAGQARYAMQLAAAQLAELLAWQQARMADRDYIEVERLRRELSERERTIASLREGITSGLVREPAEERQ
jgi:alkylation response protein AidB-like acyl-CoA dehydrogenase